MGNSIREALKKEFTEDIDSLLRSILLDCASLSKHPDTCLGGSLQNTWKLYLLLGKLQVLHELDYIEKEGK
jgi:hypothetical protein